MFARGCHDRIEIVGRLACDSCRGFFVAEMSEHDVRASSTHRNVDARFTSQHQQFVPVIDEIKRLRNEKPNKKELSDSRTNITGSLLRQQETPQQIARDLWMIESQNLGSDYLDQLLKTIAETTAADCIDLTQKTLDPDKMIVIVVGDADKTIEELKKIAPVTVIPAEE